jgi:glycosyltransferase involved in cell wall biosynthesis
MDEAAVIAVPLRMGGGMRVKVLEALSAGKAIVASPLAVAGLEVTDGVELLVASSDREFVDAIVRLLEDVPTRVRIAGNARAWAAENLAWGPRVAQYDELYRSVLQAGRS